MCTDAVALYLKANGGGLQDDIIRFVELHSAGLSQFTIEQIVKIAGDGNLRDSSPCSQEVRDYLAQLSESARIRAYIEQCLTSSFPRSGMVLQDLINELGRRLDYTVTNGRYQGVPNRIGFGGTWRSPEGHAIIVEVKTTDTSGSHLLQLQAIETS